MTTTWYSETSAASMPRTISPLAVGEGLRHGARRTLPVHGLCVHTTGSGPATKAKGTGRSPLQVALDYYVHGREGFPHYVIGYDGTIHTICDEGYIAWHAGWATRGGGSRWSGWTAPAWWSSVWRSWNATTPADLLPPRAQSPNSVYIGVELLADATGWGFTDAQYDALARLVVDVFRRQGIPLTKPPNPRLLGHEDVEPIERANAQGGWDPGARRQWRRRVRDVRAECARRRGFGGRFRGRRRRGRRSVRGGRAERGQAHRRALPRAAPRAARPADRPDRDAAGK